MGQARIVSGGPNALYNIILVKHAAKSAAELSAITARLTELTTLILAADNKIAEELAAIAPLQSALNTAISLFDGSTETRKAVTTAQAAIISKQTDVIKAQSALSLLKAEEESIKKRQAMLIAAMAIERRPAWCTDLTEDLTAGAVVGTMEMNGVDDEIIIAPGGKVSESIGLLQHVGVSTGAAVFCNRARLPAWQKWKPTYRVGRIITINYESNICDVGIEEQYSEEQGLKINQPGTLYTALKSAVSGWDDFALQNPSFALVTNTSDSTIPSTDQLLADLNTVNNYVNNRNRYTLDEQQYGKLENWTIMADGGSGDCEDYALTKASKLLALGYPASALHIEVGMYKGEGHAWLVVQTDKGDFALDNRYQQVMKNAATPYYARQRQIGMEWKVRGVLLSDVPIEYMNGDNASAFLVDDMVVVQFVGQNWNNPKVIGFEMNPRGPEAVYPYGYINPKTIRKTSSSGKVINAAFIAAATDMPPFISYVNKELYNLSSITAPNVLHIDVYDLTTGTLKRTILCLVAGLNNNGGIESFSMYVNAAKYIFITMQFYNVSYAWHVYYAGLWIFSPEGAVRGYRYNYGDRTGTGGGTPGTPGPPGGLPLQY
jgi:predicted transglutaminase-like cysteine proteinase